MVVWRHHGTSPPDDAKAHMLEQLCAVADARFGPEGYRVDDHMRNIPDHYHAHARDLEFWKRFTSRARVSTIPGRAGARS